MHYLTIDFVRKWQLFLAKNSGNYLSLEAKALDEKLTKLLKN